MSNLLILITVAYCHNCSLLSFFFKILTIIVTGKRILIQEYLRMNFIGFGRLSYWLCSLLILHDPCTKRSIYTYIYILATQSWEACLVCENVYNICVICIKLWSWSWRVLNLWSSGFSIKDCHYFALCMIKMQRKHIGLRIRQVSEFYLPA